MGRKVVIFKRVWGLVLGFFVLHWICSIQRVGLKCLNKLLTVCVQLNFFSQGILKL